MKKKSTLTSSFTIILLSMTVFTGQIASADNGADTTTPEVVTPTEVAPTPDQNLGDGVSIVVPIPEPTDVFVPESSGEPVPDDTDNFVPLPEETGQPEETGDGEPAVESPSGDTETIIPITYTDDYLQKWERFQKAKAATETLKKIKEEAYTKYLYAQETTRLTRIEYYTTLNEEQQAKDTFDSTVRGIYQNGAGDMGSIVTIVTSHPDDAIRNLESSFYLNKAAETNYDTYDVAKVETTQAYSAMVSAEQEEEKARAAYDDARAAYEQALKEFSRAEEEYGSVVNIVAPQTEIGPDGCPTVTPANTLRDGAELIGARRLCKQAVKQAATPQAAAAVKWAFTRLGAPYACKGVGRMDPFRFDCSSLVSRAYWEGAGIPIAGDTWAPSTRNMTPWDGVPLDRHLAEVDPLEIRPGDLVLYNTCPQGGCGYRHVVMYLGSPDGGLTYWMLHTNSCGDVAKVEPFWGFGAERNFEVVRRVMTLEGEKIRVAPLVNPDGTGNVAEPKKP